MTQQSGGSANGLPVSGVLSGSLPSPAFATNGTTPILGVVSTKLAAAITNSGAGSFVPLLTLPLTAGSWLVYAQFVFSNPAGIAAYCVGQLHDGTAEQASSLVQLPASQNGSAAIAVPYVAAGAVTMSLRANFLLANNVISANAGLTGSLADETLMWALRTA